jgi:3,4-dihydroxy-9,10-secoandrosta-1,3,5(10)-triene-9,17-dione 4,5-dioxygenase
MIHRYLGLGYVGVRAVHLDAWEEFATGVLGTMARRRTGADVLELKLDGRAWRVEVEAGASDGLAYLGFEVPGPVELDGLAAHLEQAGTVVKWGSEADADARRVCGLFRVDDPAGTPLEFFYGQQNDYEFVSPAGVSGFVTGPLGMGHAVMLVPRFDDCLDFYLRVLGFRLREKAKIGPSRLAFLGCSGRHHSLALGDMGTETGDAVLQHIMIEAATLDDVGRAYDRVAKRELQLGMTLGRHSNDRMISFYVKTPSGFDIEYGCDGMVVDDDFPATQMMAGDIWGHLFPGTTMGLNDMIDRT